MWKEVSFTTMINCDGKVKCDHWLLNNTYKTNGVDLRKPMYFNEFLQEIGRNFSDLNCKFILAQAKWCVIDDGIQPYFFEEPENIEE